MVDRERRLCPCEGGKYYPSALQMAAKSLGAEYVNRAELSALGRVDTHDEDPLVLGEVSFAA